MALEVKNSVETAVLLAAGRGSRLRPYTDSTPKPLLPYQGRPTLDYVLDSLLLAEVHDVVLITHHLAEQIDRYAALRSESHDQRVRCVAQESLAGTADALRCARDALPELLDGPLLVSATDYIVDMDFYPALLRAHREHEGGLTVSLKSLPEDELCTRSSVRFRQNQAIAEIVEKPLPGTAPSSIGANLCFVLPPEILTLLDEVKPSTRGEREVQAAINQWLASGGVGFGLLQDAPPEWLSPSSPVKTL